MCFTLNRLVNYRHLQQIQSYSFFPDSVAKQSMVSPSTLWEDKCANSMMGNWKWTLCRLVVPMCCPSWKKGRPHEHYPLLYTRPVRRLPRKICELVCHCNQVAYSGDHDIDIAFNNSKWVMVVALSLHSKISSDVLLQVSVVPEHFSQMELRMVLGEAGELWMGKYMTVLSLPPQISKKIYKVKNLKKSEIIKTKLENGGMQNSSP